MRYIKNTSTDKVVVRNTETGIERGYTLKGILKEHLRGRHIYGIILDKNNKIIGVEPLHLNSKPDRNSIMEKIIRESIFYISTLHTESFYRLADYFAELAPGIEVSIFNRVGVEVYYKKVSYDKWVSSEDFKSYDTLTFTGILDKVAYSIVNIRYT